MFRKFNFKTLIGAALIFSAGAVFVSASEKVIDALVISSEKIQANLPLKFKNVDGGRQHISLYDETHGIGVQSLTTYFRSKDNFAWFKGGVHDNGEINAGKGGRVVMSLNSGVLNVPGSITGMGAVPKGAIIMWSGDPTDLPDGWRLADGNGGNPVNGQAIPNLSNRFIVGFKSGDSTYGTIGNTGGAASVAVEYKHLGNHSHTLQGKKRPITTAAFSGGAVDAYSKSGTSGLVKSDDKNILPELENRPPYYVLAYIIYVGKK